MDRYLMNRCLMGWRQLEKEIKIEKVVTPKEYGIYLAKKNKRGKKRRRK